MVEGFAVWGMSRNQFKSVWAESSKITLRLQGNWPPKTKVAYERLRAYQSYFFFRKVFFYVKYCWSTGKVWSCGKNVDLFSHCLYEFLNLKIRPAGLWKIRHGSSWSSPWLCKESVMALRVVHQGGILPVGAEPSLTQVTDSSQSVTDCSQSHSGLLLEPWLTPQRDMTNSW